MFPIKSTWWTYSDARRSEEHTSELQSPCNLVCGLLLEKKKLRRAVGVFQATSGDANVRMGMHEFESRANRTIAHDGIGIEQENNVLQVSVCQRVSHRAI